MSKKLILFLMVLLFGSTSFLRADEVQIGVGGTSTNSYLPSYSLYNYSLTQQIYTAEEIGVGACKINSIAFYNNGSEKTRDYEMYLVNTSKTMFESATDWVAVTDADKVFTGTVTMTAASWITFTLDTPFDYDGTNLLLVMDDNTGSWSSGLSCYVFDATAQAIRVYSDGTNYDPSNPAQYSGTIMNVKNQLIIDATLTPPMPENLSIDPMVFALGDKASNSNVWKEDLNVKITNGTEPTVISAALSNTAGNNPFKMSMEINNKPLEAGEVVDFTVNINNGIAAAHYAEEFTLFYQDNERSIVQIPVTANVYSAAMPDVVEMARNVNWSGNQYNFTETAALHADYNLWGMSAKQPDAVYSFNLNGDYRIHAEAGDNFIAIYNKVSGQALHLTAAEEPVYVGENGIIDDVVLLEGSYYMVVASNNISTVSITRTAIPAPSAIAFIAPTPADQAMNVNAPVTIKWNGGENATQYQVRFSTVPSDVNEPDENAWNLIDENYGTYVVEDLLPTTQYFFKVFAKNSNSTVSTERRGFTTTMIAPNHVSASEEQIFTDESTLIKWRLAGQGGFTGEITVCDGTATSSYVPVYGLWVDDYTRSEMIYPAEMLEEMVGGEITSLTFYLETPAAAAWAPAQFNVYMMEVDATTLTSYYGSANAEIVYSGALDGTGTTMVINLDNPYTYDGGNLLVGIEEPVEGTYKSAYFYGIAATGASASGYSSSSLAAASFNQRDFLPKVTFTCGGREANRNLLGYNVYYGETKANTELITERQYLLTNLPYNVDPGHDINVTAVYSEGESGHSTPEVTVQVSGYGKFTGTVKEVLTNQTGSGQPVAGVTVKFNGRDEFGNNVSFEGTTNASGKYTINNVKAGTYTGVATIDGMEPAYATPETALNQVLANGATNTVDFRIHEVYKPVLSVYAEEYDPTMSIVRWSLDYMISGGGAAGGSGDEFSENFESGVLPAGWTMIDGDGDGFNWMFASATMGTGYGHNGSSDCILSQSYDNSYGVLNPNNFLVTPQVTVGAGSTFSFYACAQDNAYAAEHFGVAVSTTGNTSASDFTTIQEWTMTAKGAGVSAPGRGGDTKTQGNWYLYTVDLSTYAGQQIYIAIRHFNCSDMFYLDVDDVELSNGSKNRSLQEYAVYRKAILKEAEIVPADSVFFGTTTDTNYADFGWNNMEPGLYLYGVSAIYPTPIEENRATREEVIIGETTGDDAYVPTYNLYNYSCTNQIYTGEEIGGAGTINSIAFMPTTVNTATRNINVYMVNTDKTSFSGTTDWVPVSESDLVYSGVANWTLNAWSTIELDTPFAFDGSNLCIVVNDLTGTWTSSNRYQIFETASNQALHIHQDSAPYSPAAPGTGGAVMAKKNVIKLDINYGGGGGNDNPVTPITWSNILPKDMDAVLTVNATINTGLVEGTVVTLTNATDVESAYSYSAVLDETGTVTFEDFRKGEYIFTVALEGYTATLDGVVVDELPISIWDDETTLDVLISEICKPVEGFSVSGTGYARWTDMLPEPDRVAEKYHVTLENIFQGETTDNYMQLDTENLVPGETYTAGVAVVYTTGMSAFVTTTFTYMDCSEVEMQVENLEGYAECMDVVLTWNGGTPVPPTPPTPTGGWTEGFESGMPAGWNVIDGNSDGWTWCMTSAIPTTWTYYASLTLDWYRTGTNAICSGSYINGVGALTPDEYLVTPLQTITAGTTFSFWAAATDASYPADHFGVFVSDNGTSNWTMVNEWTLTAKKNAANGGRESRDGNGAKLGTWYNYSVDLSSYVGEKYIAIRHFNCNDQYIMCVDDIEFATPENATYADAETCGITTPVLPSRDMWDYVYSFDAAEGGQYGVAFDGTNFYTSNWGYSGATYNFYKYDLQGNMIEGFDIPGCGTLRGMTFDGDYFYGVANSSTIYCVDLANHTLVGTTTSAYGAMRCISYDPVRDGFWVVGNWSGNLTLVDRTGAIVQAGPAPESASDVAYYKDDEGVEHVYCFNNGDNGVYDYNITTGTMGGQVFNFSACPGFQSGASSGGCTVGNYDGKACFIGDVQQSPNLIGIYELGAAQGGGGGGATNITPNKFNIFMDGEVIGATADNAFTYTVEDTDTHEYIVIWVDSDYNMSCLASVEVTAGTIAGVEDLTVVESYDPQYGSGAQLSWTSTAEEFDIYCNNQYLGTTTDTEVFIYGLTAGTWTFGIVAVTGECVSEMVTVDFVYDAIDENSVVNAIYPNPTSADLHINATAMKHISVYNAMGQMVYDQDVTGDEVILNMGQYEAGVYMVNVITENGSSVKRITVTK